MDIEEYAKHVHFYVDEPPALVLSLAEQGTWKTLLDLGCGDGWILRSLKSRGQLRDKQVIAVDLSESRIKVAQSIDPRFECHVASSETIPMIPNGSVDLLVSSQVIEHVPSQDSMLREIHRVLKPDGKAYLSTVFKKWYGWYFYRCNGNWVMDPTHLREYRKDSELLVPIQAAGLRLLETRRELFWFPLTDFIFRRVLPAKWSRGLYQYSWLRMLRKIRIPILGYYNWELILQKQ